MPTNLHDLLELSLRTDPVQPSPLEDLARARRAVRRRRIARTVGTATAVAACAALAAVVLVDGTSPTVGSPNPPAAGTDQSSLTTYIAPDWVASETTPYEPEIVTDEEALERCNAIEYDDGSPDGDTVLPWRRPIHVGDQVTISGPGLGTITHDDGTTRPGETSCTVPGSWALTAPPVPEHQLRADDTDGILLACSALAQIDLREWVVTAAMADGLTGVNATLSTADKSAYATCELGDGHREIWFSDGQSLADAHLRSPWSGQLGLNMGEACESLPESCGQIYSRSNVLPTGMERMVIQLADGSAVEVPVGVDGSYAVRFVTPVDAAAPVIMTYDASGTLVLTCAMPDCPA